ncbi:MAG: DUF6457 domain-containing protein [Actinomycetota bacterium]
MDPWLDELAAALGVEPLGREESGRLLRATREVAHRVERKDAPLVAFLLGAAAGGSGEERGAALAQALDRLEAVLPPEPAEPRG